jgi:hypothetical protein
MIIAEKEKARDQEDNELLYRRPDPPEAGKLEFSRLWRHGTSYLLFDIVFKNSRP